MKPRTHDEIVQIGRLYDPSRFAKPMSREERLRRWVTLLESEPGRVLRALHGTEFQPRTARDAMRGDNTPITVAFEDPVLRAEGLRGDTYGDAKKFFGLSDHQVHHLLCYCHGGPAMAAETAAWRLKGFLPRSREPGLFRRVVGALFGRA